MAAGIEGSRSDHPADRLVRDLIGSRRAATPAEIEEILQRMASVQFPTVGPHLRGRLDENQWTEGTCEADYLGDLRRAVVVQRGRLLVYMRRGGHMAAVLAHTDEVVPEARRGGDWLPLMYVVYSADRGMLISGYQASALSRIGIPEDAQWLK